MAKIHKQYPNGIDSGLWYVDNSDDPNANQITVECLRLCISRDGLTVEQYQDWDYETYGEDGWPDTEPVNLGTFECRNPFDDDMAAERLLGWLMAQRDVEWVF